MDKSGNKKSVLIIEDDLDTLELLSGYLKTELGHILTIEEFSESKKGLLRATSQKFDLILSDIAMPEINGFEVIRQAIRQGVNSETPIMVISGYLEDYPEYLTSGEFGNVHYIQKPVSGPKLMRLVRLALDLKEASETGIVS